MRDILYFKARDYALITPNYIVPAAPKRAPVTINKRKKAIPKHVKTLVWDKYIGVDTASAACCCCLWSPISIRNFHCGHVIAEANGGNMTLENLRPICAPCNLSMGRRNMNEFTMEWFGWTV